MVVEWKAPLAEIVRSRVAGGEPDEVLAVIEQIIDEFSEPTPLHGVPWRAAAWRRHLTEPALAEAVERVADGHIRDDGSAIITREQVASHAGRPLDQFVATMAWGFGERGYGWHRTREMFGSDGQRRIPALIEQLRSDVHRPAEIWRVLRGPLGLRGMGPAFGTKLSYFIGYGNERGGPLIADRWTAWAFWAFSKKWDIRASAEGYADYVHRAHAWAASLCRRPDDVERALFVAGPYVRQIWHDATRRAQLTDHGR